MDRPDQFVGMPGIDLLSQRADIDVDHIRVDVLVQPDPFLDGLPIQNPTLVAGQCLEQFELAMA
jgi:hypothetical protein